MSEHPLVLIDQHRLELFSAVGRSRFHTGDGMLWLEKDELPWRIYPVGKVALALSRFGPNWVFDAEARNRRQQLYSQMLETVKNTTREQNREELTALRKRLRFGANTERLLWAIHSQVMATGSSVLRIPDVNLGAAIWGADYDQWPRQWRREIVVLLESLTWLHFIDGVDPASCPAMGAASAVLIHAADLRGKEADGCAEDCPGWLGAAHHHYLINVGLGFLGILEQFGVANEHYGGRSYLFPNSSHNQKDTSLKKVGKTGRLVPCYLPAKLGDPGVCSLFNFRQHRLLQALIRETTRKTRQRKKDIAVADCLSGNSIPDLAGKKSLSCPLLDADGNYAGFNGNKRRKGLGYRLATPGGWLAKAGFPVDELGSFLEDLALLSGFLDLKVVSLLPRTQEFLSLEQMQSLAYTSPGRRILKELTMRAYANSDFIPRWNHFFKWAENPPVMLLAQESKVDDLVERLAKKRIKQRTLAQGIDVDPSFLNKVLNGKKGCPAGLFEKAWAWLEDRIPSPPAILTSPKPRLISMVSNLEAALGYLARGWSIIPQKPAEKKPYIKWKEFQDRCPAEAEVCAWWKKWPDAGILLIAGPVSGVLVIDSDGTEASQTLLEHLGQEPIAPKVLSGSRQPDRYHLFFKHPAFMTKAKATPWHPELEFRGHGGLIVLPPSVHKSGNRYDWAPGQSLDDLPLSPLPDAILTALHRPRMPLPPAVIIPPTLSCHDLAPSTHRFLKGENANALQWNQSLFKAACDLKAHGILRDEAEPMLLQGASPWNAAERDKALRTIHSAYGSQRSPSMY